MDYQRLDQALDQLEPILLRLAGDKGLVGATIERWRWDQPAITLRWVDRDTGVSKDIGLLLLGDSASTVSIEVNGWLDEDQNDGSGRIRRWNSKSFDAVSTEHMDRLKAQIGNAYDFVSEWKEEDLDRTHTPARLS